MKKLSPEITIQVKGMLPVLRKETKNELAKWSEYVPGNDFYSDDKVLETLPFAANEYLLIGRDLKVDKRTIIEWLNDGLFIELLPKVVAHALRRLAVRK